MTAQREAPRYSIEDEAWFQATRTALESRGFSLRLQPRSLIIETEGRLPRIVGSARELLEFATRQGLRIEPAAFRAADRYGDGRPPLPGEPERLPFDLARPGSGAPAAQRPPAPPPPAVPEAERALRERCAALEAQLARLLRETQEITKQRDLYHMSAAAAEDRVRALQAELGGPPEDRGPDKRFNRLKRLLARELHPDLAGEDEAERAWREAIFKRMWARMEQL